MEECKRASSKVVKHKHDSIHKYGLQLLKVPKKEIQYDSLLAMDHISACLIYVNSNSQQELIYVIHSQSATLTFAFVFIDVVPCTYVLHHNSENVSIFGTFTYVTYACIHAY